MVQTPVMTAREMTSICADHATKTLALVILTSLLFPSVALLICTKIQNISAGNKEGEGKLTSHVSKEALKHAKTADNGKGENCLKMANVLGVERIQNKCRMM